MKNHQTPPNLQALPGVQTLLGALGRTFGHFNRSVESIPARLRQGLIVALLMAAGTLPAFAVTVTELANDAAGTTSFTGATNWDNNTVPTAGNTYSTGFLVRTPGDTNAYTFAGDSLTLNLNGILGFKGSNVVTVNNLILNGGIFQQTSTGKTPDWARFAGAITLTADSILNGFNTNQTLEIQAPISGGFGLKILSSASFGGVVLFSVANPDYTGNLTIMNNGDLALGVSGSIDNAASISIAAKSVFDVSARSSYVLSANTTLSASGTGEVIGSSAATIKGASAGTVSLGSQAITLNYSPTYTGDTTHPALLISQGALTLNNNPITVNIAAVQPLGNGTYRLVEVTGGSITGTPNATPTITGTGLATGATAAISVSGGNVNLVVSGATATPANLTWTIASGSITDGSGSWDQGSPSLPNGAPWYDGASYGNIFNAGDNVTFGGGTAGAGGTITLFETVISPGNLTFVTNANPATIYTIGANAGDAIVMFGGKITNNATGNTTFNAPLNGSFTYYSPASRQLVLLADGNQTPADIITVNGGSLQLGSNSGHGNLGAATIINNTVINWRRSGNFTVASAMSGPGRVQYQLNTSVCTLNAPQTQTGYTMLVPTGAGTGNSTLLMGGNNLLSSNSDFILNQTASPANSMIFDLNGFNQTVASIASDVNATVTASVITNSSATFSTLTLGGNNRTTFFKGLIAGKLNLTLNGTSSTLTLSNANTYTGNTTINAGTLALGGGSIASTPLVSIAAHATFDISGAASGFTFTGSSPQQTLAGSSTNGTATNNAPSKTVTLNTGARLSFQAAGGGSTTVGNISVAGTAANLTLNNNTVTVNVTGSALAAGSYRLLDCTGTLTGSANSTPTIIGTALSGGFTATVSTTTGAGGHVDLVVTGTSVAPNFPPGGISLLPGGGISLTITGAVSTPYRLWSSTNLALTPITNSWTLLNSGTITVSPFTITDLTATNSPQRFYLFSSP